MNKLSDKALNYVRKLAPHIKEREAAKLIQECAEALNAKDKQINELKKKCSQGEINEAYAKTIERQDIERQKQSFKLNKRNQKIDKLEKELQKYRDALAVSTGELRDWYLKGGGKSSAFICANNLKLLKQN